MLKLKIAIRNVLRNGRRTFLSTAIIAGGIAAIALFQGLTHNLLAQMSDGVVNLQFGHLEFASEKIWTPKPGDHLRDRLIKLDSKLQDKISHNPSIAYASGRINFFGLVSFGEQSLSAHGTGYDPENETQLNHSLRFTSGRSLNKNGAREVVVGATVARYLGLKVGDTLTLMAHTYDGAMNAYDCEVVGLFENGLKEIDNGFYISLATAQSFLDTDGGIEEFVVHLNRTDDTEAVKTWLQAQMPGGWEVKSWQELSDLYRQVVDFHKMENRIVMWLFMVLALMATLSTVSLTIFERTGEIGTQRAIGDSRTSILGQFVLEGIAAGTFGGALGITFGFIGSKILNWCQLQIVIPGMTFPTAIQFDVLPWAFRDAVLVMCLVALAATLIPAYRASHMEIVEALKRNV